MATAHDIAIGNQIFGFTDDSRQFHRLLKVNLPRVHSFDQKAATSFLQNTFAVDLEAIEPPRNRSGKEPTAKEVAFLTSSLCLAKTLLRASGLPSFEREKIVEFPTQRAKKNRIVTLEIPVVESMAANFYLSAYKTAFQLITEFTKPISKRRPLKKQADDLKSSLIDPIRRMSNGRPLDIFILKEAFERGVQICHYGNAVYRLGIGSKAYIFSRSSTERDSAIGFRTSTDKTKTLSWLRQSGVPTPRSILVSTSEQAQRAADNIGYPIVIKPANRDRSEGVTLDIMSAEQVRAAFEDARKWSDKILVEERIPGVCHRLVTFKNEFVFAFTRHPKAVVGDGETTVRRLIDIGNEKRDQRAEHVRGTFYPTDTEALERLAEQGLELDSVPDDEQIVFLRHNNSVDDGGHNEIITDKVHPENIKLAERISKVMRLESMGLDLITTDPTRPWFETGARITEVNATPQIGANSAKSYIDMTFGEEKGTIPVHCFVGDAEALEQAISYREKLEASGLSAYLTSSTTSIGPGNDTVYLTHAQNLFDRASILQNLPEVEALILVIQDDEFLVRGRPMLTVNSVTVVSRSVRSFQSSEQWLPETRVERLIRTMEAAIGPKRGDSSLKR